MSALVVNLDSVQSHVALVASRSVHGAVARVTYRNIAPVPQVGHARLEAQQVWNIAAFHRQLLHLILTEGNTERGARCVQGHALSRYLDGLGLPPHRQ